jgi:anti-sigma B factor antagonist
MSDQELRYRVQIDDASGGEAAVVRLKDQFLNYTFADQLKGALKDLCKERMDRGVRSFVVDLTAVSVMDSCGLSVLIGLRKLVDERKGRLVLFGVSPIIQRLLSITRLDKVFEVCANEAEATAALARPAAASQPQPAAS